MQSITIPIPALSITTGSAKSETSVKVLRAGAIESLLVRLAVRVKNIWLAFVTLRKPALVWKTYRNTAEVKNVVWAGELKKMYKIDGRYYFNMYTPGWPSAAYDNMVRSELKRYAFPHITGSKLSFVFLAVTRKCPLKCEHCFEWKNLNKPETFSLAELKRIVELYQAQGVQQFHFTGGEPLTRIKDLVPLVEFASGKSECWVITSGFNLTAENARQLKRAGCKGISVSVDHYDPEWHNSFRGNLHAFNNAIEGIAAAKAAGLVVTMNVCATKSFIDGNHLSPYLDFAKEQAVPFVQVLEPRSVGHYEGMNVLLDESHIQYLETFFKNVNHSPRYKNYPTLQYHGYHQRRIGCFAGSRSIYIDAAGDVHACPFCHTSSYNVKSLISQDAAKVPLKENECPMFNKIA